MAITGPSHTELQVVRLEELMVSDQDRDDLDNVSRRSVRFGSTTKIPDTDFIVQNEERELIDSKESKNVNNNTKIDTVHNMHSEIDNDVLNKNSEESLIDDDPDMLEEMDSLLKALDRGETEVDV